MQITVQAFAIRVTKWQQIRVILGEIFEFVCSGFADDEGCDVIQSIITYLEHHTPKGFESCWWYHTAKMESRDWKRRNTEGNYGKRWKV